MVAQPWFPFVRPSAQTSLRFFAFPYAGGGATAYQSWRALLPPGVELWSAQLPGRETRLGEPAFQRLAPLVSSLLDAMRPYLDRPFVLFGHSLGSLIAFELARALRRASLPAPAHILVSGYEPPPGTPTVPPLHTQPDAELIAHLRELQGTPPELLADPEFLALLLPTLRSDAALDETYVYAPEAPLESPLSVFGGVKDNVSREVLMGWGAHTREFGGVRLFEGDHFYLVPQRAALLAAISATLAPVLAREPRSVGTSR